jgi:hypothetical protein
VPVLGLGGARCSSGRGTFSICAAVQTSRPGVKSSWKSSRWSLPMMTTASAAMPAKASAIRSSATWHRA